MFFQIPPEVERVFPALKLIVILILVLTLILAIVSIIIALHFRKVPPSVGEESLKDQIGVAKTDLDPEGEVYLDGALWKAESIEEKILAGEKVKVIEVKKMKLKVQKFLKSD